MAVPMIAGLYPYTRNGVTRPPKVTLQEIPQSLKRLDSRDGIYRTAYAIWQCNQ